MNNKTKKKILIASAIIALATYHSIDYRYVSNYKIINSKENGFATYSSGRIFVGDIEYLCSIKDKQESDIFVEDQRDFKDPNFKIYSSYLINDKRIRNEILEVLCIYEELHPSNWNRTIESMRVEWLIHNLSHFFNYEKKRTIDVDLNNNDEELYNKKIYRKILKL